jgi:hypothetical protein
MTTDSRDPVKDLLRHEAERVSGQVLQDPSKLSDVDIERLARLTKLVEIRRDLQPKQTAADWTRWAAPAGLVLTLAVVTVLLFTHVNRTEIELDVRLSQVALRPRSGAMLVDRATLVRLTVSDAQEISVRQSADWAGLEMTGSDGNSLGLEISPVNVGDPPGIHLSAIPGGKGTRAWIQPGDTPREVRLSLESDALEIQASLTGPLRLAGNGVPSQIVDFKIPRPAFFRASKAIMNFDLTASDDEAIRFARQIGVDAMSLYEVEQFDDRARRLSSVISGSVFFAALNGAEEKLRAGQELRLDRIEGEIRTIQLASRSLALQFHGDISGLETGSYDNPRNLMPAWLEWLRARHGVSLLWGTALYVFGIVSAAARWFNRPRGSD